MKEERKNRRYYRKKRNASKKNRVAILVGIVVLLCAVAAVFLWKSNSDQKNEKKAQEKPPVKVEDLQITTKQVDAKVLQNLVDNAEKIETTNYTKKSVKKFRVALKEAKQVLKVKFRQRDVEVACKNLVDAIQNLKYQK